MARQSQNLEDNKRACAESTEGKVYASALPEGQDKRCIDKLAVAPNNQGELVEKRVIPNLEIQKEAGTGVRGDWKAARVEARQQSAAEIASGKTSHEIRYGDTLWDIASANFAKNSGHKGDGAEITAEINRIAQKNNIANPNKIDVGVKIDLSMDKAKPRQDQALSGDTPNYYNFNGSPRTNDQAANLEGTPNYYNLNGGRRDGAQNYYQFNGGNRTNDRSGYTPIPDLTNREVTPTVRVPDLRQPQISRDSRSTEVPLTPETTRQLLGGRPETSYGARNINVGGDITPQPKNTAAWRNGHNENVAKANRGAPTVAFYGDSITHGLQLNPNFKSFAGGSENFGIDGDRTENLLYRLKDGEASFPGGRKPDTAVLLIGTNNIGSQSPEKIASGILANAQELTKRMPGTEVIVMGVLPRGTANDPVRAQVKVINDIVRQQLQGVPGVKFVDVGPQLTDARGNMRPGVFQRDNVHPSYQAGYSAILSALRPYVRSSR